jgi:hypothetical protein
MVNPSRGALAAPRGVAVPEGIVVVPPPAGLSSVVAPFFGRNGMWWGTWRSPQVKGDYDAILIVREIASDEQAEIVYLTPDYPNWYITASRWEATAAFVTRDDGAHVLRVPYAPAATTMDFWFEGTRLRGITYGRFMRRDITLRPLPG